MAEAFVTLSTNDSYALGALVLGRSLRRVSTSKKLVIMVTKDVTASVRKALNEIYDEIVNVDVMDSNDAANLCLLKRPELGITLTKIHCWSLTQYSKCVFLDADTLVVKNCDELFEKDEFSAAPDVGWPDAFNSGVFVFRPSSETFQKLIDFSSENGSFDGGDQGLLNMFFSDWTRISFLYNMVASATYTYTPAYKFYGAGVKIVHFLGLTKPWEMDYNAQDGSVSVPEQGFYEGLEHARTWWQIFTSDVKSLLQGEMVGVVARLAAIHVEDTARRTAWETGRPDVLGKDSFVNVQTKIAESIAAAQQTAATQPVAAAAAAAAKPAASAAPKTAKPAKK